VPLVTRRTNQGNIFNQDDEPATWQNGDLWADSNSTPRELFINDDGTARRV